MLFLHAVPMDQKSGKMLHVLGQQYTAQITNRSQKC